MEERPNKKQDKELRQNLGERVISNNYALIRGLVIGALAGLTVPINNSALEIILNSSALGFVGVPLMDKYIGSMGMKNAFKLGPYNTIGFFAGVSCSRFVKTLFGFYE